MTNVKSTQTSIHGSKIGLSEVAYRPSDLSGVTINTVTGLTGNNTQSLLSTQIAQSVYLNLLVDDADHNVTGTPCNLILNGTVFLTTIEYDSANY